MIRAAYNILILLTAPIWVLWMLYRTRKRKEAPLWTERWGNYALPPKRDQPRVWIHAVSVGEVVAARPIISALREVSPHIEIVLTCTTSTGHSIARSLVGKSVNYVFYFPIDVSFACKKALASVKPDVVAIMETELWMNFLHFSKRFGAATMIVNGRVSQRSFTRSKRISFFYEALLNNVDRCLMQTQSDADRIIALGANSAEVFGNSKYDEVGPTAEESVRAQFSLNESEPWIVVGSARGEFEEDFVLEALTEIDARILFAPRHTERADEILAKARRMGYDAGLRSRNENSARFLILDTYGELASTYSGATLAIVGGGFDNLGGQNVIQPLSVGCPVVCGPNMSNFKEPFEDANRAGALLVAASPVELRACVSRLLKEPELRKSMSDAGRALIANRTGASLRYARAIAWAASPDVPEGVQ